MDPRNQKTRKNNGRGNNSNRNKGKSRGNKRNRTLVFDKGDYLTDIAFTERDDRIVSLVGLNPLGIPIYPQSLRFQPRLADPSATEVPAYYCSVNVFENKNGQYGLALPVLPYDLSPDEWLPTHRLHEVLVVDLMFRQGHSRVIAYHAGRTVLLERGKSVPLDKKVRCLLEEHGRSTYAIPLSLAEQEKGGGLVRIKDMIGDQGFVDSEFIIVDSVRQKPGILQCKTEADVAVTSKYQSAYEILSSAQLGITIDASSTVQQVKDAFKKQVAVVHPDSSLRSYKDRSVEPPVMFRMMAESGYKRLTDAKDRAMKLLEPKVKKAANKKGDVKKADGAKVVTSDKVTKKKTAQTDQADEALRAKRSAAAKKAAATRKRRKEEAATKVADEAKASAATLAYGFDKKAGGESESRLEKFNRKYVNSGTSATSAGTPKKPKSKTVDKKAADKGSMADQLTAMRADLGPAK